MESEGESTQLFATCERPSASSVLLGTGPASARLAVIRGAERRNRDVRLKGCVHLDELVVEQRGTTAESLQGGARHVNHPPPIFDRQGAGLREVPKPVLSRFGIDSVEPASKAGWCDHDLQAAKESPKCWEQRRAVSGDDVRPGSGR